MTEEEKVIKFLEDKIEECSTLIQKVSYIGNKKAYAKDRTGFKQSLNLIQNQDTEINKLNKINDLMAKSILNYDDQLVINQYRDKEHVKETFTEYAMKEDK